MTNNKNNFIVIIHYPKISWYGCFLFFLSENGLYRIISISNSCSKKTPKFGGFFEEQLYFLHEFGSENESFYFRDIRRYLFQIIREADIFYFCSFFECDFCSLHSELLRELDSITWCEYISECVADFEIFWHKEWLWNR